MNRRERENRIHSFLWNRRRRGGLKCPHCSETGGRVISGNYSYWGCLFYFKCLKCDRLLNSYGLAQENGFDLKTLKGEQ